jgi:hypothetical protein
VKNEMWEKVERENKRKNLSTQQELGEIINCLLFNLILSRY